MPSSWERGKREEGGGGGGGGGAPERRRNEVNAGKVGVKGIQKRTQDVGHETMPPRVPSAHLTI